VVKIPAYINIGKKYPDSWKYHKANGTNFRVLNPRQLLMDLIRYQNEPDEWDLKNIYGVGAQGSGKSNFFRYFAKIVSSIKDYQRVNIYTQEPILSIFRTNDMRVLKDSKYSHLFEDKSVIVMVFDDIIQEGFDSRRAMENSAIEITRAFCTTRHILEENYEKSGIIFMLFGTQDYMRLDPTIRNTAQLKLFTNYYDERWFKKMFTPSESELLRIATYEGMYSSHFKARRFNIAKTMTGDVATLEIPFISKNQVHIPFITRSFNDEMLIKLLIEHLMNYQYIDYIDKFKRSEIIGYLEPFGSKLEDEYAVKVKARDYNKAINRVMTKKKEQKIEDEINGVEKPDGWMDDFKIVMYHDTLKKSFKQIESDYGIPHSTAYNRYCKAKARLEMIA
jgi:hypothetical protein